jgi:hypothetical protein
VELDLLYVYIANSRKATKKVKKKKKAQSLCEESKENEAI